MCIVNWLDPAVERITESGLDPHPCTPARSFGWVGGGLMNDYFSLCTPMGC